MECSVFDDYSVPSSQEGSGLFNLNRIRNECNDEKRGTAGRKMVQNLKLKKQALKDLETHKESLQIIKDIVSKYPILGRGINVKKGTIIQKESICSHIPGCKKHLFKLKKPSTQKLKNKMQE